MAWLVEVVQKRPKLRLPIRRRSLAKGRPGPLGEHRLRLSFHYCDVRGASAETGPSSADGIWPVTIKLPEGVDAGEKAVLVEKLLYKIVASRMQAQLTEEVLALNAEHFRVGVSRVKLSATTSRWGSCSTSGTISLSTRLLGAPAFCRKAVIVHELAHRIEMNHSDRFWKLVYGAMPEYAAADGWLREHGGGSGGGSGRVERGEMESRPARPWSTCGRGQTGLLYRWTYRPTKNCTSDVAGRQVRRSLRRIRGARLRELPCPELSSEGKRPEPGWAFARALSFPLRHCSINTPTAPLSAQRRAPVSRCQQSAAPE